MVTVRWIPIVIFMNRRDFTLQGMVFMSPLLIQPQMTLMGQETPWYDMRAELEICSWGMELMEIALFVVLL